MNTQAIYQELMIRSIEERTEKQRGSLYEFIKYYREHEKKETLNENWHIEEICRALERVYL